MVAFAEDPGHWHATPCDLEAEALRYAKRHRDSLIAHSRPRVEDLARGFFSPSGAWARRMLEKGHHFVSKYLLTRQGHLDNYIVPAFGDMDPRALTRRMVDDAILGAGRAHGGAPLSGATKNKIVYSFNLFLEDLVDRGILDSNPLVGIVPYSKAPAAPREALPRDTMDKLFPASHGALVQVWGNSMWAAMMLLFQDTGMRPGEIRALRWREVYDEKRFIPIRHGIEAGTKATVKGTKTNVVKAGFLSSRTVQELGIWRAESRHGDDADFVFTLDGEAPVTNEAIVGAFRRALDGLGIESKRWTPYYLRHSFATYQAEILTPQELNDLMGHSSMVTARTYQHLDDAGVFRKSSGIQKKLDKEREGLKHGAKRRR